MNKILLKPADRVVHPAKPDWGVGKVLSASCSGIEVFLQPMSRADRMRAILEEVDFRSAKG